MCPSSALIALSGALARAGCGAQWPKFSTVSEAYVHGYDARANERLRDQAATLVDLLHSDTAYPTGSLVLEAGCGVGAQTITLARRSPGARFTSITGRRTFIPTAARPSMPSDVRSSSSDWREATH